MYLYPGSQIWRTSPNLEKKFMASNLEISEDLLEIVDHCGLPELPARRGWRIKRRSTSVISPLDISDLVVATVFLVETRL